MCLNEIDDKQSKLIESMMSKKYHRRESPKDVPWFLDNTRQFYKAHFSQRAFEEWSFDERSVSFLSKNESEHYLPKKRCSAKFKIKTIKAAKKSKKRKNDGEEQRVVNNDQNMDESNQKTPPQSSITDRKTLNLFESLLHGHHATFFTGDAVYSGAWCPYPSRTADAVDQILCISTNVKNRVYNVFDCDPHAGCLQFWNFGTFRTYGGEVFEEPKLDFIIAHNYGTISEMVWCPGGTSYSPKTEDSNGRLGLLALACTDGYVRILSIPLVEELNRLSPSTADNELKVIKLEPVVILEKHPVCLSMFNKPSICKSISWSPTDQQRYIVTGYGNGLISIFDLKTESSLLKKVNSSTNTIELKPKKSWIGHGACVNSIKWIPLSDCSYIVSGGFDRYVKVWCLEDMANNIVLPKKAIITNAHWSPKYIGCYLSSDDCYSNLHNNVTFRDMTGSNFVNSLSRHRSCVWDFDISEWNNMEASVDASGEATLSVYVRPKNGKKYSKSRPYECLPIYRLTYEPLTEEEEQTTAKQPETMSKGKNSCNVNYLISQEKPIKSTKEEMMNSYGLMFNDVDLTLYSRIPTSEFERLKTCDKMNYPRLGDYPLTSLNKIQFNPNRTSSNFVFTAGESGLSRVSYIEFLKNPLFSIND